MTIEGRTAALQVGERQVMKIPLGPLSMPWVAEITAVEEGRVFEDTQLSGPFAKWVHRHHLLPMGNEECVLKDEVRYRLPLHFLSRFIVGGQVRRDVKRLFTYRHAITLNDLRRHAEVTAAQPMTVLITGGSGLVGTALTAFLTTGGHEVRKLVRSKSSKEGEFTWDPMKGKCDARALDGVDAVVHLAGENIAAGRWSSAAKERILESRVRGTRCVVEAIRNAPHKPKVFVSASAVGFYGDRGDETLDESAPRGTGFLADVCSAWESEASALEDVRTVQLRLGVILSSAGGALKKMLLPFKLGVGGRLGSGRQWMSWITLDDVIGVIHHALFEDSLRGPVNCVAPDAATNAEFTIALGRVLSRPTLLPAPGFALKLALGEMAQELLLSGQRVEPKKLIESGFRFDHAELEAALRHVLGRA